MFSDKFTPYLLLIMIFEVQTTFGSYYVSKSASTWMGKDSVCSVALPPILYKSAEITAQINDTSIDKDGAWVGYVETLDAFEYIGCLKLDTINNSGIITSQTSRIGSPGECFGACSLGTFIGVSNNECLCLKEDHTLYSLQANYTDCNAECKRQPGVACGGQNENGTSYISVYGLNPKVPQHTKNSGKEMSCLVFEPKGLKFIWKNCSTDVHVVCGFDDEICLATSTLGENRTWLQNANTCFSNGGFPIRFRNRSDVECNSTFKTQIWTNVIRSCVIKSIKRISPGDVIMRHGFVRTQDEHLLLDFANNSSMLKRVVCDTDQDKIKTKENLVSDIIVPVGVSTGVSLLFAAVVIFFVIHRRRGTPLVTRGRKNATKRLDHDQLDNQTLELSRRNGTDNHAYDSIADIVCQRELEQNNAKQTNNTHTYFVLEKHEKESKASAYDTTWCAEENASGKGSHIYDRLNSDKTYDHVYIAKHNMMNTCDNPYTTTEKAPASYSCKNKGDIQTDDDGKKNEDAINRTEIES